ncbi:DUF6281 family protein [Streptomyces sp. NBC_00101]|uniref:DUF6281 family protein n=1 Tax=Streptomyces sp. NBC_00101 TaxID=2975651 RepID=UPI003252870B
MNGFRRFAGSLGAAAMVMSVVACTAEGGGGDGASSCADVVTYQDQMYIGMEKVTFTAGKKLGVAVKPSCEDTGGRSENEPPQWTKSAYEVDGLSPQVAVAVGDTPETATLYADHSSPEVPPEVEKLRNGS